MKNYTIRSIQNHKILFEGQFKTFHDCLEAAVFNRIHLGHADLRSKNLTNANLDDAILPHADFTNSNLCGANLSEAILNHANLSNTDLYNTCLSYSNMTGCNFEGASFGGTDIAGSVLSLARFSTLSCFSLNFASARQMDGCTFTDHNGKICEMSRPPIVIRGIGNQPVILFDHKIYNGHRPLNHRKPLPFLEKLTTRTLRRRLSV